MDYIDSEIKLRFKSLSPLIDRFFKIISSRSKFIYQSNSIKNSFQRFDLKNSIVMTNPVSYEKTSIRPLVINKKEPIRIIYTGRLTLEKGFDRFLKIHSISIQDPHVEWHCYGLGPLEFDAKNREKICSNFHYHGWQSREKFENVNSVMVVPSRIEGVPNIVLEAIMAGWPVIVSREVYEIFESDPIVRERLYCFDFGSNNSLTHQAKECLRHYNFEDHMEILKTIRENRDLKSFIKIVREFCLKDV
jgi:glycosyltransferase involved in cell wall biosynthesis